MKKLINEILGGIFIAAVFIILTVALIKSPLPSRFFPFYLALEIIAFIFFFMYGAVTVAAAATIVAIGTLIIAGNWFSVAAIVAYWGAIIILYNYLSDVTEKQAEYKLLIENKEKSIGMLVSEEDRCSCLIPVLNERISRYMKLAEFSLKLSTTFDHNKLYSFIMEYVNNIFPFKQIKLLTIPEDQYDVWVINTKKPLIVENIDKDYRFTEKQKKGIVSLIDCPIFQEDKVTNTIKIESKKEPFSFSDLRLLSVACTLFSIALERAKLFSRTEELAITDDLTGLYTHSHFKERLEEEVKRASRYREKFAILMLDIDDFKNFNDAYGHPSGDIILKNVAEAVKKTVRETDIVGRYGGEEISVILLNISSTEATAIAKKIREAIEAMKFVFSHREVNVTATIGASSFPECSLPETLIGRADEALYKGKHLGKNTVVFYKRNTKLKK
ncbi:diguanylate cyclase [Elusimicrobiota bacterium]